MGFEIPKFNSFYCCSLRTASITVAVFQVLILLLYTVGVTVTSILFMRKYKVIRTHEVAAFLLYLHSLFIHSLVCLLLLYGTLKEKSGFVMAWLLFVGAGLTELIWSIILSSSQFFHWSFFLEDALMIGLETTAFLIVYNYYRKMPKESY